jgi:hypothetical protein
MTIDLTGATESMQDVANGFVVERLPCLIVSVVVFMLFQGLATA